MANPIPDPAGQQLNMSELVNKEMTSHIGMERVSLTKDERNEICRLYETGDISQGQLAKQFNVSKKYVHHCIQSGKRNRPRRRKANDGQKGLITLTKINKPVKKQFRSIHAEKNSDVTCIKADGSSTIIPKMTDSEIDRIVNN
jgi:transposase